MSTVAMTAMSGQYPPYINVETDPTTGGVRVMLRGDRNPITGENGPTAVATFSQKEWASFKELMR